LRLGLDSGQWTVERYWQMPVPSAKDGPGLGDALDSFEAALLESVERRLIADVPVGAFLSGGLDSSLIVAAMRRLGHTDTATFSAIFPGSPDNEESFAKRVSARFGTRHFEYAASPDSFLQDLD